MKEIGEKKGKNKLKLIGSTVLAAVLLVSVVAAFWNWVDLQKKPLEGTKRQFDASLDFVKTIATIAGGVVLFLNFRVANRSAEIAQKKLDQETEKAKADAKLAEARLTMERFSKAVDMMGSDKSIHLRLGGIYALESIALDSSDNKIDENYRQVLEVLTAFVRENSPYPPKKQAEKESTIPSQLIEQSTAEAGEQCEEIPPLPTDIQAALTVLNRRKHKDTDWEQYPLDLRKTDLRRANLVDANFQGAKLEGANLQQADLSDANLKVAKLEWANLQQVILEGARLDGAYLGRANLKMANLKMANLQEADLQRTNLQWANLKNANLLGADLKEANLQGAVLESATLQQSDLRGAFLQGDLVKANLRKANLWGANLWGAVLQEADFRGANLQGVLLNGTHLQRADLSATNLLAANLQEADLFEANLQESILIYTDLRDTRNFTQDCLEGEKPPLLCNVALPKEIPINPNRDCDRLSQELVKRYPDQFPSLEDAEICVDEQRQKKWE